MSKSRIQFFISPQSRGHAYCISKDETLLSFGDNTKFQLALGDKKIRNKPSKVKFFKGRKIKKVVSGNSHSLIQTHNDEVYGVGNNYSGQLSLGDSDNRKIPTLIKCFGKKKIQNIYCGAYHTVFVVENEIFTSGRNSKGQLGLGDERRQQLISEKMKINEITIIKIKCGNDCTLLLSSKNELYKSGLIYKEKNCFVPILIFTFNKEDTIKKISCGWDTCLFLTNSGKVFGLGRNNHRNLTTTFAKLSLKPRHITVLKDIIDIKCAHMHSLVLDKNFNAFAFGNSEFLGCSKDDFDSSGMILLKKNIFQIESGCYNIFLFDKNKSDVWVAGYNEEGTLGLGNEKNYNTLEKNENLKNLKVSVVEKNEDDFRIEITKENVKKEVVIEENDELYKFLKKIKFEEYYSKFAEMKVKFEDVNYLSEKNLLSIFDNLDFKVKRFLSELKKENSSSEEFQKKKKKELLKFALVVGNSDYKHFSKLKGTINDAKKMSEVLKKLKFEVTTLLEVDSDDFYDDFESFLMEVQLKSKDDKGEKRECLVIIYYSGHGLFTSDSQLLLPIDLNPKLFNVKIPSNLLNNAKTKEERDYLLEREIKKCRRKILEKTLSEETIIYKCSVAINGNVILFLDCCRNYKEVKFSLSGEKRDFETSDCFVSYSTEPKSKSLDLSIHGGNSPFTRSLSKRLLEEKGEKLADVLLKVKKDVEKDTSNNQKPSMSRMTFNPIWPV